MLHVQKQEAEEHELKTVQVLPDGYIERCTIDLQKNKKEAVIVNVLSALIALVMFAMMERKLPFMKWTDEMLAAKQLIPALAAIVVGMLIYVILHEFTHGAVMRLMGGKQVRYGFTGMYAYAGSEEDYFPKRQYLCIALAPVLVWGIIFLIMQLLFTGWEWVVWFLQIANVGGAAGDIYVSAKVSRMSSTILVRDTGVSMTVFDA